MIGIGIAMARQTPILIDLHDSPERTPVLAALPDEEVDVIPSGPALGMGGLPVSTGPRVDGPRVVADVPAEALPEAEGPEPIQVVAEVDEEDPWEDPPAPRTNGIPDWAPISAMGLCLLVSMFALADRLL